MGERNNGSHYSLLALENVYIKKAPSKVPANDLNVLPVAGRLRFLLLQRSLAQSLLNKGSIESTPWPPSEGTGVFRSRTSSRGSRLRPIPKSSPVLDVHLCVHSLAGRMPTG